MLRSLAALYIVFFFSTASAQGVADSSHLRPSRLLPIAFVGAGCLVEALSINFDDPVLYLGTGHFLQQEWLNGTAFLATELGLREFQRELTTRIDLADYSRFPNLSNNSIYQRGGMSPSSFAVSKYADIATLSLFNLRLIDFFASYRTLHNKSTYTSKVPLSQEGLLSLSASPFKLRYLIKPWVWGPVLLAGAAAYLGGNGNKSISNSNEIVLFDQPQSPTQATISYNVLQAYRYATVAAGEEMFFRGALQTELTENFSPAFALVTSSLLFGLWHIPHNGFSGGVAATVGGFLLGYRYQRSNYDLGEVIALHFWLDWIVSAVEFFANPRSSQFVYRISWMP